MNRLKEIYFLCYLFYSYTRVYCLLTIFRKWKLYVYVCVYVCVSANNQTELVNKAP